MFTKLYLIRHGKTEGAESNRYKGHIDVPLSENGIEQMERLAQFINAEAGKSKSAEVSSELSNFRASALSAVYCSDLRRAVKSAEIIAKPYSLSPVVDPLLRECNFGLWEGMSFNEIKLKYPEDFEAWAGNPLEFSPMQGESTIEVRDRAIDALNRILNHHIRQNSENIAIVAHGGINRIILCQLLSIPLENIFRIEQDFGALNIIEFHDEIPVVKRVNCLI